MSAVLPLGTTLTVLTDVVNDTQWDGDGRTTTFGPGFHLLTVALLSALGATVTTVLALRRPTGAFPGPAQAAYQSPRATQASQPPQPAQSWQTLPGVSGAPDAPVAQPYPSAPPPAPHQPPPPPPAAG